MAGDKAPAKDTNPEQAGETAAKVEAPRTPADPRLKIVKKLQARYLPKGPLRERSNALLARWDSNDHGGVTVDELKSLIADWRVSREKKGAGR